MHLRDADLRGDLRLRHLVEEAQLHDSPLTLVERVEPGRDERPVLDLLDSPIVLDAELLREACRRPRPRRARGAIESSTHARSRARRSPLPPRPRSASASSATVGDRPSSVGELVEHAGEPDAELLQAPRDVHRPGLVAEVPADLADDRRHRVARELDPAVDVEAVDGLDQAERRRPGRDPPEARPARVARFASARTSGMSSTKRLVARLLGRRRGDRR